MFSSNNEKRFANWFPGKTATCDRWGTTLGAEVKGREFQASTPSAGASERMRWSLGHA